MLFERSRGDSVKRDDKFQTVAGVKQKRSKMAAGDDFDSKMRAFVPKIVKVVESIQSRMDCEIALPDGQEDYQRRKKRAEEFASRFSRNYLYQLSREVSWEH